MPDPPADELTPERLTELLGESRATDGHAVVAVECAPVGAGQVASCLELRCTLDTGEALSLVAKVPSDDPVSLATANGQHLYEREVRFYESIAPTVTIRTPQCHHASFDATTGRFLLLLESLAPAAACDQLDGLAPVRAALAVDELAGLHAPHWGSDELPATSFLASVADSLRPLYAELIPVLFTGFLDRYGDELTARARGVVEWLSPNLGAYFEGRETPPTVTHGDYRTDNLLFDGRSGEVPLATVDWQTIGHGPGALDLAYLLTTSLDTDARRAHERDLLDRYRSRLGELGVTTYSRAALAEDYAFYAFQGIVMLVCAAVLVERTPRGDAMFLTMIERSASAVDDLDSRRLLAA